VTPGRRSESIHSLACPYERRGKRLPRTCRFGACKSWTVPLRTPRSFGPRIRYRIIPCLLTRREMTDSLPFSSFGQPPPPCVTLSLNQGGQPGGFRAEDLFFDNLPAQCPQSFRFSCPVVLRFRNRFRNARPRPRSPASRPPSSPIGPMRSRGCSVNLWHSHDTATPPTSRWPRRQFQRRPNDSIPALSYD
jgi:hypothetical protein